MVALPALTRQFPARACLRSSTRMVSCSTRGTSLHRNAYSASGRTAECVWPSWLRNTSAERYNLGESTLKKETPIESRIDVLARTQIGSSHSIASTFTRVFQVPGAGRHGASRDSFPGFVGCHRYWRQPGSVFVGGSGVGVSSARYFVRAFARPRIHLRQRVLR